MAKAFIEVAVLVLFIGWVVYPCGMCLMGCVRSAGGRVSASPRAAASVVIATRDGTDIVSRRIANLECHRDELVALEIIVAVDCSGGIEAERYRDALGDRAIVVDGDAPGGKAATLNAGVRAASYDVLIFADSAQEFLAGAMRDLVEAVRDPAIGAATGRITLENNQRSILLAAFWSYESWLRKIESTVDSIVGVTGAIYAMRKSLWEPLPPGLINDDLYVPLAVILQGSRVVTCETALAVDRRKFAAREEFRRKVRTLTGVLQLCALRPSVLNPRLNRVWIQFVCHKLLRFSTPYWILLGAVGAVFACPARIVVAAAVVCGAATAMAAASPKSSFLSRVLRQAGWSMLLLSAPFIATANGLRRNWNVWEASASGAK